MTKDEIERLGALEKAATEAPWFKHDFSAPEIAPSPSPTAADVTVSCDHPATITVASMGGGLHGFKGIEQARKDAAFIAALRNAAPALIASAKALAEAQAKADECEVDWEVWNTENTRLQSALAAAQARIAELVADLATAEARIAELVEGLRPFATNSYSLDPAGNGNRNAAHIYCTASDISRAARLLTELTTSHPTQSPTRRESS